MAKRKTIYRQVDQLFALSRKFGEKKKEIRNQGKMADSLAGAKTYDDYRSSCMRWAEDLAQRRGTSKFQICDVKPEEIEKFLQRVALTHRPETVHQYCAALKKLENMTDKHFGKVEWKIEEFEKPKRHREDVTVQRGPAYTPEEAGLLIQGMNRLDKQAADTLNFIRATGCRAESIFGRLVRTGGKIVVNGVTVKEAKVTRDFTKAVRAERIDLSRGTVTLCEKGGKWRTVKYDRQYQSLMKQIVREHPYGSIFSGLKQSAVYRKIKEITIKSGFEGRGLHGMRKTFAVQRHGEYVERINNLVEQKDWHTLSEEFSISNGKAKVLCKKPYEKTIGHLARLRLTKDLGHNRVEVTYRYVMKK